MVNPIINNSLDPNKNGTKKDISSLCSIPAKYRLLNKKLISFYLYRASVLFIGSQRNLLSPALFLYNFTSSNLN